MLTFAKVIMEIRPFIGNDGTHTMETLDIVEGWLPTRGDLSRSGTSAGPDLCLKGLCLTAQEDMRCLPAYPEHPRREVARAGEADKCHCKNQHSREATHKSLTLGTGMWSSAQISGLSS